MGRGSDVAGRGALLALGRRAVVVAAAVALVMAVLVQVRGVSPGPWGAVPTVKLGMVAPFEGLYRAVGYDALYAVKLAVREANAAGGVGGYRLEMVALDDRLAEGSTDSGDLIHDTYLNLVDVVPPEIALEFRTVLANLQAPPPSVSTTSIAPFITAPHRDSVTTTVAPFDGEGYLPSDSPEERISDYLDTVCRGVANNPGPPPTVPDGGITIITELP